MSRLNALANKVLGTDSFGLSNYDNLQAAVAYLLIAGADQPSAATVPVVAEFFGVTGTATIATFTDALGAVAGQQIRVWIKGGPLIIQNNGGGTGNIRTASGSDTIYATGAVVEFVLTGAAVWQEQRTLAGPGQELDYKQITADVTGINATTEGTAQGVITGNSITYDGSRVRVGFYLPASLNTAGSGGASLKAVVLRDSTVLADFDINVALAATVGQPHEIFDTPASGAHTYAVKAFTVGGTTPMYTIKAGLGGSGAYPPATLRVTRA